MTPSFFITKSFVTKIDFAASDSAQLSATPISHMETSLHVDVGTSTSESNMYHLVEIHVNISSVTSDNTPVYNLILNYAAIVGTPEFIADETVLNEILKIQVPRILLDNIRTIVYQVTREAGFPFMMRDNTFDNPIQNDERETPNPPYNGGASDFIDAVLDDESELSESEQDIYNPFDAFCQDTPDPPESEKVDFQWLINLQWAMDDEELMDAIKTFLNLYTSQVGKDAIVDYESMPIYKCYYRFFTPIEYHHPDFEECDESIWPILFQMLYGSFKSQCQVIDAEQGLPEIEFSYEHFQERTISSLNLEELKELLSDLITEALTDLSVNLLGFQNESVLSMEQSPNNQLMSERDFYHLFDANVSDENASFLGTMYERIKECSLQTLLYQS